MKAALQHKNGDPTSPDVLSVVDDAAVPEPAAGQVLVKVSCASVNPIDYKLVAGDFPGKKAGPFGCDVSGTVLCGNLAPYRKPLTIRAISIQAPWLTG